MNMDFVYCSLKYSLSPFPVECPFLMLKSGLVFDNSQHQDYPCVSVTCFSPSIHPLGQTFSLGLKIISNLA